MFHVLKFFLVDDLACASVQFRHSKYPTHSYFFSLISCFSNNIFKIINLACLFFIVLSNDMNRYEPLVNNLKRHLLPYGHKSPYSGKTCFIYFNTSLVTVRSSKTQNLIDENIWKCTKTCLTKALK